MAYSAYAVANAFVDRATKQQNGIRNLTPMKLQRLMYFTQVWHLKGTRGMPILDDNFARWQYGPVIPAIYHKYKAYKDNRIKQMVTTLEPNDGLSVLVPTIPHEDKSAWSLVDSIINHYGNLDVQTLSEMSNKENSAYTKKPPDGSPITNQEILEDTTIGNAVFLNHAEPPSRKCESIIDNNNKVRKSPRPHQFY